jgi:phage-related protein
MPIPVACLGSLSKILYRFVMSAPKPIAFCGSALDDLRAFPVAARREAGHPLDQLQQGRLPDDWKPMTTIGSGVQESRIRDASGAFRLIDVAKFPEAVYVLHCFQTKTQKTSQADLNVAEQRYRDLIQERTP